MSLPEKPSTSSQEDAPVQPGEVHETYVFGNANEQKRVKEQSRLGFDELSRRFYKRVLERELGEKPQIGKVFIGACGMGSEIDLWNELADVGAFTCCDIDAGKVEATRRYAEQLGIGDKVQVIQTPIGKLKEHLKPNSIQIASIRLGLQHVDKKQMDEALQAMVDALTDNGLLVIEDFDVRTMTDDPPNTAADKLLEWFLKLYDKKGTQPAIGPELRSIGESYGLTCVGNMRAVISSIGTVEENPFKALFPEIYRAIGVPLVALNDRFPGEGFPTQEEYDAALKEFIAFSRDPETICYTPYMYQQAFRKDGQGNGNNGKEQTVIYQA